MSESNCNLFVYFSKYLTLGLIIGCETIFDAYIISGCETISDAYIIGSCKTFSDAYIIGGFETISDAYIIDGWELISGAYIIRNDMRTAILCLGKIIAFLIVLPSGAVIVALSYQPSKAET